jgi:hypothetical protein
LYQTLLSMNPDNYRWAFLPTILRFECLNCNACLTIFLRYVLPLFRFPFCMSYQHYRISDNFRSDALIYVSFGSFCVARLYW